MLVDFPWEWRNYFVEGKALTFSADTPDEIIKKAKNINEKMMKYAGKEFFHFEDKTA